MVNIVGAGLAGSILKRHLDSIGIENRVFDCEREWRSSNKSENLFSRTWSSTLGQPVVDSGITMLEGMVDIQSVPFLTRSGKINDTLHVPVKDILIKGYTNVEVKSYDQNGCYIEANETGVNIGKKLGLEYLATPSWSAVCSSGITVDCRGWWARKAIVDAKMIGLTGQGLFFNGQMTDQPVMNFISPYVHQKLFQFDEDRMWYGDSTCIHYFNYLKKQEQYISRCIQRSKALVGDREPDEVAIGIRPWVKGHKGYLKFHGNVIVNTGGWKCGLIIYAHQAKLIGEHLKKLLS